MSISFGREICGVLNLAAGREWVQQRGVCIAQAWTVAEVLRAWIATEPTIENSEF
ncbi:hypothetical protein GNF10_24450 [Nostoc sp. UCD121]|uniref:hypothetical protein n=1 Tax=unclassified Nostoc TaxID=2593658 RepID=UPI00162A62DF|nr:MULTISPECIES: hypothetical protein [unclassified Nostoc]MBC1221752.1 hypothetical protein [Nostoc sp. UCD120]MBC1279029.1 hypothetical protein [Nostoc sp. UCD121]MBC1295883.1 hypothetical protein [Nostoc sp. UCD122]